MKSHVLTALALASFVVAASGCSDGLGIVFGSVNSKPTTNNFEQLGSNLDPQPDPQPAQSIIGRFKLTELPINILAPASPEVTIEFAADGSLRVQAFCNSMEGKYSAILAGGSPQNGIDYMVEFSNIISTARACGDAALNTLEGRLVGVLSGAGQARVLADGRLSLSGRGNNALFIRID